jgi:two-component system sensor histidine kinase PilS (NtrC family)
MLNPALLTPSAANDARPESAAAISAGNHLDVVWRSISHFCFYRIVIAVILSLSYWGFQRYQLLSPASSDLAAGSLAFYFLSAVALLAMARIRSPGPTLHVTAQVVFDVASMIMLMHASGGVRSGIGLLLLVTLAASGVVVRGRIAYFHAALASLAVLFEQSWQFLLLDAPAADYLQSGLLAGSFFVVAGLGYTLAKYAQGAEQIAEKRGVDLANLAQINELVIRDMQDGFVVVDEKAVIRQHNPQSEQLIGGLKGANGRVLAEVSPQLAILLEQWRRDPDRIFSILRDQKTQKDFQVRFVAVGGQSDSTGEKSTAPTVVFIEDAGRIRIQAQQMKLVALGRLTASIAHEIRNPLSSINHAAELMQEDSERSGRRPEDLRLLSIIQDNAHRLDRMVQEVLYLNRRDRAHPEPIDAESYLKRFLQDFCANEKLDADVIALVTGTTRRPLFDRSHLDQILWNLVRNARAYCSGGKGSVSIGLDGSRDDDTIFISVSDDGPGVPTDALPHLFEPFFTTASSGTGLGLYIAKELAEVNGATLDYVSNADETRTGACFRLSMKGSRLGS